MNGRIQESGRLDASGNATINIHEIKRGKYQVFIIKDGDINKEVINLTT
jgi:hypothetical protein